MKKWIILLALIGSMSVIDASAQCPMCRTAVESGMDEEGNTKGRGLNSGILYLLATPYLAVATLGYFWYKKNRAK